MEKAIVSTIVLTNQFTKENTMRNLLCMILTLFTLNLTSAQVEIPDTRLRETIMKQLGKQQGETITKTDMSSLRAITAKECKQLTGIETATCLETLVIVKCQFTDISEVKHLTNLIYLTILDTPIREIKSVSNLSRLNSVLLHGTQVKDIEPLVSNNNLGMDSIIRLDDNPLNYKSQRLLVPKLLRKGIKVSFSPKCPLYDINTDGRVSVLDMILIGQAIANNIKGKDIPEDVNYDEVVDIEDIRIVSNNLSRDIE